MFAMVDAQRRCVDVRFERVVGVGQVGQAEWIGLTGDVGVARDLSFMIASDGSMRARALRGESSCNEGVR